MYVLQWKCIGISLFCIKADWNSLYGTDVIHRTDLVKICQCDMTPFLIDLHRRDRRRDFLDQSQIQPSPKRASPMF